MCAITAARHLTIVSTIDASSSSSTSTSQQQPIMKSDVDWLDDEDESSAMTSNNNNNNNNNGEKFFSYFCFVKITVLTLCNYISLAVGHVGRLLLVAALRVPVTTRFS